MKPIKTIILVLALALSALPQKTHSQELTLEVIKQLTKKIVRALDLRTIRFQNDQLKLQNIQKALENSIAKMRLDDVAKWTEKQKDLYKDYFEELQKVRSIIYDFNQFKNIGKQQVAILNEYKRAYNLIKSDKNFSPEEVKYIYNVYTGMIDQSVDNLEQLEIIIKSYSTQMKDSERLVLLKKLSENMDEIHTDLREFTNENISLSLSRARDQKGIDILKSYYGLVKE